LFEIVLDIASQIFCGLRDLQFDREPS
jgi:hypothetical protein